MDVLNIEQVSIPEEHAGYDRFIFGSGILIKGAHPKVLEFFQTGRTNLQERLLGTFIVCGSADGPETGKELIGRYFGLMHASLSLKPPLSRAFGGRLLVDRLSVEDREKLTAFYRNYLNQDLRDWDLTDSGKAKAFGGDIDALLARAPAASLLHAG